MKSLVPKLIHPTLKNNFNDSKKIFHYGWGFEKINTYSDIIISLNIIFLMKHKMFKMYYDDHFEPDDHGDQCNDHWEPDDHDDHCNNHYNNCYDHYEPDDHNDNCNHNEIDNHDDQCNDH